MGCMLRSGARHVQLMVKGQRGILRMGHDEALLWAGETQLVRGTGYGTSRRRRESEEEGCVPD